MKKILVAAAFALAGVSATGGFAYADVAEAMKNSKYCEANSFDPLCMGPEWTEMRTQMLAITKDKALEGRTKYCRDNASADDPICKDDMINSTNGY